MSLEYVVDFVVDVRVAELGRSKNGNENFRQTRIYNFCVKCVVVAGNRKFAKLTQ